MLSIENKIHLWIGSNFLPEEQYISYFQLDYSVEGDFDDPNYKICQFCKDVGLKWYDEDFIGIIPRHKEDVSLDDILVDAAVDDSELNIIKEKCNNLGIKKANAIFWYQNEDFEIKKPIKDFYNGLKYIGLFQAD
ncbi:TPA: immunity 22 family protein [Providencia stuartii]|uniref:immunity 22 family protein n=1 Tax=Providencia stuartii TaxID=588 RepID=UPI00123B4095|nr:immunity 22 family protein [Providencia stuartii]QET98418.1 hypothetical protein FOB53_14680 [Providencia stuartii]HEM8145483.1 immunity 22 family protein [Providencia stuartii]HEM8876100.1 immunity 22 family protein [Providencia stuartii]